MKSITDLILRKKSFYTPASIMSALKNKIAKINLKSEYSKLRKIGVQRLERLRKSEYAEVDKIKAYIKYGFEPLKNLQDDRRFAYEMTKLVRFLDSDYTITSLKQLRAQDVQSLETLHAHGYTFITRENYDMFAKYMDIVRSRIDANVRYVTETIMNIFEESLKSDGSVNAKKLEKAFNAYVESETRRAETARKAVSKLSKEEIEALKKDIGQLYDNR